MYGNKRVSIDVDEALNDQIAFRMNGMFENSDSFRQAVGLERYGLTPTLTIAPGSRTKVTVRYEYLRDARVADRGITSFQGRPADVDIATFYGNPDTSQVEARVERRLFELVKIRASQINGCAYCLDMHTKEARLAGETEQRIYALNAWRETPFFSDRERAALEWTETVTRVADTHVPDEIYERVKTQFDEAEVVALTFAIVVINSWNRLAVSFRVPVGSYQPRAVAV